MRWTVDRPQALPLRRQPFAIFLQGHGGLLLGEVERPDQETVDVKVMGVEPCESGSLPSVLTDCGSVLGFYRFVDQGELAFSDFDMNLAISRFPSPDKVFLLVKPSGSGAARACFFFWNDKGLSSEQAEFPVVERQGGITPFGWLENIPRLPPSSTQLEGKSPESSNDADGWKRSELLRRFRLTAIVWLRRAPAGLASWKYLAGSRTLGLKRAIAGAVLIATAVLWVYRSSDRRIINPAQPASISRRP